MLICQRCRIAAGIASRGVPVYRLCRASPDAQPVTFDQTAKPCCGGKHEPPSLWTRAKGFGKAIAAFVADPTLVSTEQYQERLTVCQACPEFDQGQCKQCGCFTALKARLPAEACPLGKWPNITKE